MDAANLERVDVEPGLVVLVYEPSGICSFHYWIYAEPVSWERTDDYNTYWIDERTKAEEDCGTW